MTNPTPLDALTFHSLSITRDTYGEHKGRLKAEVRCGIYEHAMTVQVPEPVVHDLMKLIVPIIASEVQRTLTDVQRDAEQLLLGAQTVDEEVVEDIPDADDIPEAPNDAVAVTDTVETEDTTEESTDNDADDTNYKDDIPF